MIVSGPTWRAAADLAIGGTSAKQCQHLLLPRGQVVPRAGTARCGPVVVAE